MAQASSEPGTSRCRVLRSVCATLAGRFPVNTLRASIQMRIHWNSHPVRREVKWTEKNDERAVSSRVRFRPVQTRGIQLTYRCREPEVSTIRRKMSGIRAFCLEITSTRPFQPRVHKNAVFRKLNKLKYASRRISAYLSLKLPSGGS